MDDDSFFDKTFVPMSSSEVSPMPNQSTRIFLLRDLERNPRTPDEIAKLIGTPAEALFDYAHRIETPGLAYALVDLANNVRTLHHIAAGEFRGTSIVFGRHSHTDTPTEANNLALRHLVMTQRVSEPQAVEVRDLRSIAGTRGIAGGRINAARIETPLSLDLGDLFVVATATPVRFDKRAFLERIANTRTTPLVASEPSIGLRLERFKKITEPRKSQGFSFTEDDDGDPSVALRLEEMIELTPTPDQLLQGFMIGRYARCDWPAQGDGAPSGLSRVHAVVFASQGQPYIADTGSTNGLKHQKLGCLRYKHLEVGDQFWLGKACRLTVIEPRELSSKLQA